MDPAREHFLFMPPETVWLMYLATAVSLGVCVGGLYRAARQCGLTAAAWASMLRGGRVHLKYFLRDALGQRKIWRHLGSGALHGAILYGTIVLFVGTALVFLDFDLLNPFGVALLRGRFYVVYEWTLDLFGLVLVLGASAALIRRGLLRSKRLTPNRGAIVLLVSLLAIAVTGFLLEGTRLFLKPVPWGRASFVGAQVATVWRALGVSPGEAIPVYQVLWWVHASWVFCGIATLPWTGLSHLFFSSLNLLASRPAPSGGLRAPFSLKELVASGGAAEEIKVGVGRVDEMDWRQRLGVAACVNCGRCEEVCPAWAAGRDLSPRSLVQDLRGSIFRGRGGGADLFPHVVREDEVWSCTACGACAEACPVAVDPLDLLVDLRRSLVGGNRLDDQKARFLEHVARHGNPYGLPGRSRLDWLAKEGFPVARDNADVDYLYWIGCQSAYDERCRGVVRAVFEILRHAGVGVAILPSERCSGEPVRRLGEEGRFQELALENIEALKSLGARKVLTHCPHCFNTLKNEYGFLGGDFEVLHHTQLIALLVEQGRLKLDGGRRAAVVTYHDPCNLGRLNGVCEEPRRALEAIRGLELREMALNRDRGFCCGGGGANPFYRVPERERISDLRKAQARRTGASLLAVGCPFCLTMFADAAREGDAALVVKDVAELVAEALVR